MLEVKEMDDAPTELTRDDIDKFFEMLKNEEIKKYVCIKCFKEYIGGSYGHHIQECDECWFSRFPKEEVMKFYKSFFE